MMSQLIDIGIWAGFFVGGLLAIGMILMRLYKRTTKEISFVRTGFGGQRVIMNGGALVFPVLHEIISVNMNTLRLAVNRANEQALITRDRMRVDVVAEFYVRVQPTVDSIANAAQTLGPRTTQPDRLKDLIEGKFVDALRSVAAEMSMEELHEKRVDFVQKVQHVVSEDLLKNGLELEAVSLTGLDQTSMEHFNPNNAFDAEGLTRLTEEIETRNKIRNDIEQDTAVQIKNKNLEAERKKLEIGRDEEFARLEQQREVEVRRASQAAEIAKEQADKRQESENATILADQQIQQARIASERAVEEERIDKERLVEVRTVEKEKALRLAEQDREIAVEEKSKEESIAKAFADEARAKAIEAEEKISTAREREIAERDKQIELIEAAKHAERDAIKIKVAAEAEKIAAGDIADARREEAQGDGDKLRILAEAEAESERVRAAAAEVTYAIQAVGEKSLNEAANVLSDNQISMRVKLDLIKNMEAIVRESVKPMDNIDSIKIFQLDGLTPGAANGNGGGNGGGGNGGGGGSLPDQLVNSALKYRAQGPLVDALLKEVGIEGGDVEGFSKALGDTIEGSAKPAPAAQPNQPAKRGHNPAAKKQGKPPAKGSPA